MEMNRTYEDITLIFLLTDGVNVQKEKPTGLMRSYSPTCLSAVPQTEPVFVLPSRTYASHLKCWIALSQNGF